MGREYHFDDEKGNTYNLTVNHYHMRPHNPIADMMKYMAMASYVNKAPALDINQAAVMIEQSSTEKAEYEILDSYFDDISIEEMSKLHDITHIKITINTKTIEDEIIQHYNDLILAVKDKLSHISHDTSTFIISVLGYNICIAYTDTDYFDALFNKFNKDTSISFTPTIADKLNIKFKSLLKEIDYVCDTQGIYSVSYSDMYNKFKIIRK